jgi:hypothetical protein
MEEIDDICGKMLTLVKDADLSQLVDELAKPNIFELVGLQRQEIRHSAFLCELLNPGSHLGVGKRALNRLVRIAFSLMTQRQEEKNNFDPFTFELGREGSVSVHRELYNIDILIIDQETEFLIAIENKIGANESEQQLEKYRNRIEETYPNFRKLFLFLSPEGREAETDDQWIPISWSNIADIVRELISLNTSSELTNLLLSHYLELTEKHILKSDHLEDLANKIYLQHQDALDFIFEKKLDKYQLLNTEITNKIKQKYPEQLTPMKSSKKYIRLISENMAELSRCSPGKGWGDGNVICWEIAIDTKKTTISIVIGPIDNIDNRTKIRDFLMQINKKKTSQSKEWTRIVTWTLAKYTEDFDIERTASEIANKFQDVIEKQCTLQDNYLRQAITELELDSPEPNAS